MVRVEIVQQTYARNVIARLLRLWHRATPRQICGEIFLEGNALHFKSDQNSTAENGRKVALFS